MDKLKMETKDLTEQKIEKIGKLFPNVITEMKDENGNLKKGINFEILKQELSKNVVDGEECFDFTWVGKRASIIEANTPIQKTLRPSIEESKNWETTENIYIEGDNLDVLKLLQESYLGKIKMIYIDPPYNTGNDSFVYSDKYEMDKEEYEEQIQFRDEEENINFRQNSNSNPRFHSDWCSMMNSRLKLAHSLLSEDGVIFISIDDGEIAQLKKICDEIFGQDNFIANLIWNSKGGSGTDAKSISIETEYILLFKKQFAMLNRYQYDLSDYTLKDEFFEKRGFYKLNKLDRKSLGYIQSLDFPIEYDGLIAFPGGTKEENAKKVWRWRWSKEKVKWGLLNSFVILKNDSKGITNAYYKIYEKVDNEGNFQIRTRPFSNIIPEGFSTSTGTSEIEKTFNARVFEYPKPTELIINLLKINSDPSSIILDFFSGSATTAHAVMQLNAKDGGNRKFIMVQLPEPCPEDSEAFKAGYKTIAEIGKERIRRAGEKIKKEIEEENNKATLLEEKKKVPDIGFRVFKVDSNNMKEVFYSATEYTQEKLIGLESNIKEDRSDLDLLYGVLLEWGLPLSLPHETKKIDNVTIHIVDHDALIACFSENVTEKVVREIAQYKPLRVVFRDSCFSSSPEKINVEEIFKLLSPNTSVKVL